MRADDALKYAAALLKERTDWTVDSISGAGCDDHHEIELNAISDIASDICGIAAQFGRIDTYSDGRRVKTSVWITDGLGTSNVWHPDVSEDRARSWRSALPSGDPDVPSPGIYEVTTDPATQDIHVRVVRIAS